MPIWGWVCIGLTVAAILALVVMVWLFELKRKRLMREGQPVVARILLANPTLYDAKAPAAFEFAFVVFTRDYDTSDKHLAFLGQVIERLEDFVPDPEGDRDEQTLGRALATQRTVGQDAIRVPDRVTGGREVFFSTPSVFRRMLPGNKLTRNYLCLQIQIDDRYRDVSMIEYPDAPTGKG